MALTCPVTLTGDRLVYALVDPFTGETRYVGKSTTGLNRPKEHFRPSQWKSARTHKQRWIRKTIKNGKTPIIFILFSTQVIDDEELSAAEVYWINYFRENGSNLTNATLGGEGAPGRQHTEDAKEKISASRRGKPTTLGHKHSEESKKKMSNAKKGRTLTKEHKEKISESLVGNKRALGYKHTEEFKNRKSQMAISEETRRKMSEAQQGRKHSPETRLKMSVAAKKREALKKRKNMENDH